MLVENYRLPKDWNSIITLWYISPEWQHSNSLRNKAMDKASIFNSLQKNHLEHTLHLQIIFNLSSFLTSLLMYWYSKLFLRLVIHCDGPE